MKRFLFAFLMLSVLGSARTIVQPVIGVDSTGSGVLITVLMTLQEGRGVFVSIEPLVKIDTQESIRTAIELVKGNATGRFLVQIPTTSYSVEGPSAGAAFSIMAKALLENKTILPNFTITGTIDASGTVGQIGGVYEKVLAARKGGITLVLVPRGEAIQSIYVTDGNNASALRKVNLTLYAKQEWNMSVIEVGKFETAAAFAFGEQESNISSTDSPFVEPEHSAFVPEGREYLPSFDSMKEIAAYELNQANDTLANMLSSLKKGTIEDDPTLEGIYSLLYSVKSTIDTGFSAYEKGYYYTAANYGFLSNIDLRVTNYTLLELNVSGVQAMMEQARRNIMELKTRLAGVRITPDNSEWYAGAVQRAYWADVRLSEVSVSADYNTLNEIAIVQEWTIGSGLFLDYLDSAGEAELNQADFYPLAKQFLDDAEAYADSFGDAIDMTTPRFHIDAAIKMLVDGNYVGVVYEASEAKAIVASHYAVVNLTTQELKGIVERNFVNISRIDGGAWYSMYFDHAYYYYLLSNRSSELQNLAAALEYQMRVKALFQAGEALRKGASEAITPVHQVQTVMVYDPASVFLGMALLGISLIFFGLAIFHYSAEKPRISARDAERTLSLLDKLDESLAVGRIEKATYKRLEKKYISKLKSLQEELKK